MTAQQQRNARLDVQLPEAILMDEEDRTVEGQRDPEEVHRRFVTDHSLSYTLPLH